MFEIGIYINYTNRSGKRIDLDINNHSFYSLFVFITVQYAINPNNKNLLSQILAGGMNWSQIMSQS